MGGMWESIGTTAPIHHRDGGLSAPRPRFTTETATRILIRAGHRRPPVVAPTGGHRSVPTPTGGNGRFSRVNRTSFRPGCPGRLATASHSAARSDRTLSGRRGRLLQRLPGTRPPPRSPLYNQPAAVDIISLTSTLSHSQLSGHQSSWAASASPRPPPGPAWPGTAPTAARRTGPSSTSRDGARTATAVFCWLPAA